MRFGIVPALVRSPMTIVRITNSSHYYTEALLPIYFCSMHGPAHLDFLSLKMKWDRSTSLEKGYIKSGQNRNFILLRNQKLLNVYPDIKTPLITLSN